MQWLEYFLGYVVELRKTRPNLVICGDYNICHKPIDIHSPKTHEDVSGFLPEEREWFDRFVGAGFVDSFRCFNDMPEQYTWWSYRANAREKNLGWRIDYHIVTESLVNQIKSVDILPDVKHSDHCPIVLDL